MIGSPEELAAERARKEAGIKDRSQWRSFEDARTYVHSLKFNSHREWWEWCKAGKRPLDIPTNPRIIYKEEWAGTRRVSVCRV